MRRRAPFAFLVSMILAACCAVGPGYRRSSLGLPDGWRRPTTSEDSLRSFFDSLRTSRDTLLPPGTDSARVPFAYDTAPPRPGADSAAPLRWLDLIQDSVLRQLVDTGLRQNRDMRTALAVIDEFRAQYRATRDRKSTRLNSSHGYISYAVFCLKKKKPYEKPLPLQKTNTKHTKSL